MSLNQKTIWIDKGALEVWERASMVLEKKKFTEVICKALQTALELYDFEYRATANELGISEDRLREIVKKLAEKS